MNAEVVACLAQVLGDDAPTLRDQFAMRALAGVIASVGKEDAERLREVDPETTAGMFADTAYRIADAMMVARKAGASG